MMRLRLKQGTASRGCLAKSEWTIQKHQKERKKDVCFEKLLNYFHMHSQKHVFLYDRLHSNKSTPFAVDDIGIKRPFKVFSLMYDLWL